MSRSRSSCRHETDGNAVASFRLPSRLDDPYESRSYALNPKRADGLQFRMVCSSRWWDGEDWTEFGVVVSEFASHKSADCRLRCRVVGEKSQVVVESDWERFTFARGPHQRWKFKVPRQRLEDAQRNCGPLFAEFELQLQTGGRPRRSPVRGRNPANSNANIPFIDLTTSPGDPDPPPPAAPPRSTFHLDVPDVNKRTDLGTDEAFEDVRFFLRYFPSCRNNKTANLEFILTHFSEHPHVRLGFELAVENHRKQVRFHRQSVVRFERCDCQWIDCQHKFKKTRFHVDRTGLGEFAEGRPVRYVLKLRFVDLEGHPVSPVRGEEAFEPAVPFQEFENPHANFGFPFHDPFASPRQLEKVEAARPPVQQTPAGVPISRRDPRVHRFVVPPPALLSVQPEPVANGAANGAANERPAIPTSGLSVPPSKHVSPMITIRPIVSDKRSHEAEEIGTTWSPTMPGGDASMESGSGVKQEVHNDGQLSTEQRKQAGGGAVKMELRGEEGAEEGDFRKRRLDLLSGHRNERPEEKRQRMEDENEEKPAKGGVHRFQGPLLTIVVGGKEFEVERDLLIDESGFFAKKLAKQEDPSAGLSAVISSETMAAVVEWMKTKQMDGLDEKARELYVAAKLLGMPAFQKTCVESIKRTCKLASENHAAALIFAAEHEDAELLKALDFVWERPKLFRKMMKSPEFDRMLEERPALMKTIVASM